MLEVYQNQGFEHSPADYTFLGLEFIGTCGSFPEQYDVVWTDNGVRYQVGYVRLRGGVFSVYFPDVTGFQPPLWYHTFATGNRGSFDTEAEREEYLFEAAKRIGYALNDLSQGGS